MRSPRRLVGPALALAVVLLAAGTAFALDVFSPTRQLTSQDAFTSPLATPEVAVAYNSTAKEYLLAQVGKVGADSHVVLQRVSATGAPIGDTIDVAAGLSPDLAYDAEHDRYLLVYPDLTGELKAQLLTGNAAPDGSPEDMHTVGGNSPPQDPAVAYNPASDRYLVVWRKDGDDIGGGISNGEAEIYARRVGADGTPLDSAETFVSVGMGASGDDDVDQVQPDVAADPGRDEWMVVWSGERVDGGYVENEQEIWTRRVDTNGAVAGTNPADVSQIGGKGDAADGALRPAVAFDSETTDWLVAWEGDTNVAPRADNEFEITVSHVPGGGSAALITAEKVSSTGADGNADQNATRAAIAFVAQTGLTFVVWQADTDATGARNIVVTGVQLDGNSVQGTDTPLSDGAVNPSPPLMVPAIAAATPPIGQALVVWPATVLTNVETFGRRLGVAAATLAPAPDTKPTVAGTPAVGQTLTCTAPAFTGDPSSTAFSWLRDGAPIAGATAATYVLTAADAGHAITCKVSATNLDGTGDATSDALAVPVTPVVVATPPPTPSPSPTVTPPTSTKKKKLACKLGKAKAGKRKVTCTLKKSVKAGTKATLRRKGKIVARGTASGRKATLTGAASKLKKGAASLELKPRSGRKSKLAATVG